MTRTATVTLEPTNSPVAREKPKVLNRLRRLEGQVRGLQKMIEDERPCKEVLTLLAGVRSALDGVGELILETYLEECQADFQDGKGKVQSVVEAVRLLRR